MKTFRKAVFCLTVSLAFSFSSAATARTPLPVLDVPLLMQAFTDNREWAERQFAGREMTVRGMVVSAGMSTSMPCVALADTENSDPFIVCVLPKTDFPKLAEFRKGTRVTMTGTYFTFNDENRMVIRQCRRVRPERP